MNKELLDVLESLKDDIFTIEDIDYLYGDSYYDSIIDSMKEKVVDGYSCDDGMIQKLKLLFYDYKRSLN